MDRYIYIYRYSCIYNLNSPIDEHEHAEYFEYALAMGIGIEIVIYRTMKRGPDPDRWRIDEPQLESTRIDSTHLHFTSVYN